MTLILASQSPRRRELLTQLGVKFDACPSGIDETPLLNESPQDYVLRLAIEKASVVFKEQPNSVVLGSDTSVISKGKILGKPGSKQDGVDMLLALSGQTHQVLTAIALVSEHGVDSKLISTKVTFRHISREMAEAYWETGEPQDKAGGYGIQGMGGMFVTSMEGSYSSVVGLPLAETADLLMNANIKGWWSWRQA